MKQKSFTLIELLVVMAILGLIASIILVSLRGGRERATIGKGLHFSGQIQRALGAYAVGIWNFNEIVGIVARDISGNGNDGLIFEAISTSSIPELRKALRFDGFNDYVYIGDKDSLEGFSQVTIEAWVKPEMYRYAYNFIAGKEGIYKIDITLGAQVRFLTGNNWAGAILTSETRVTPGNWYHIAATYDGFTKRIFINGSQDRRTVQTSGSLGRNDVEVTIGACEETDLFTGLIDEVRIYNRALTTAQIQKHYAEGAKRRGIALK